MYGVSIRERRQGSSTKGDTLSIATDGGAVRKRGERKYPENWWRQVGREG